jgi:hypothetical protein
VIYSLKAAPHDLQSGTYRRRHEAAGMKQREFPRFSVRCRLRNAAVFDPMPCLWFIRKEEKSMKQKRAVKLGIYTCAILIMGIIAVSSNIANIIQASPICSRPPLLHT